MAGYQNEELDWPYKSGGFIGLAVGQMVDVKC